MAVLVVLNGPPASGKSTIAKRFVEARPLSLNLDVDVVRGMLGGWLNDPVGQMYDAFVRVLDQRPATRRIDVVPGDIDQTFARFEKALDNDTQ